VLFWILIAFLTAAAILAVLLPLTRAPTEADPIEHARRVYLDQLNELERDNADGRLNASEAEAARAEIARRLLALEAEREDVASPRGNLIARRAVAVVALAGIPILSLSLYFAAGQPDMPGAPLAARLQEVNPSQTPQTPDEVNALVARVEKHLADNPEDGSGWEVIAPVYMRLDRPADAARAWRNVIRLLGSTADRQMSLGEALWTAEQGMITAEARAAFEAANKMSPQAPGPRFFLALAAEQEGNVDDAKARLTALLADAPPDAPWRDLVVQGIADLEKAGSGAPGPTPADVAAAQNMGPEEQVSMIEGMVKQLSARLKDNPDDAQGWLMLIRSNVVLGRKDAAVEAARSGLKGVTDPAARGEIEAALAELTGSGAPASSPVGGGSETAMANGLGSVPPGHPAAGPSADDIAAAQNMTPEERSAMADSMVGRLAARLKDNPDDIKGWLMLIRSYAVLGKPDLAEQAARDAFQGVKDPQQRRLIEDALAGLNIGSSRPDAGNGQPLAGSGQPGPSAADVAAAQNMAPEDRSAMIETMVGRLAARLKDNPDDAEGWLRLIRSYIVLGKSDQAEQAARDALAGVSDPAARQQIEAALAQLTGSGASPQPGPTSEDVAAAQTMTPQDRTAMIEGMVGRLAARLKDNPSDVEGWLRLIRSYTVLGKADAAAEAAGAALAGVTDPGGRQRVEALIADLGVTPKGATQ